MDITERLSGPPPCECGCKGERGHILSSERWDQRLRCTALTVNRESVLVRCKYPKGHSDLVPHNDGNMLWQGVWQMPWSGLRGSGRAATDKGKPQPRKPTAHVSANTGGTVSMGHGYYVNYAGIWARSLATDREASELWQRRLNGLT